MTSRKQMQRAFDEALAQVEQTEKASVQAERARDEAQTALAQAQRAFEKVLAQDEARRNPKAT